MAGKEDLLEKKKAELETVKNLSNAKYDFDEEVDTEEKKPIFSVYGHKNDGKTMITYGIPWKKDKVVVFSFDNKSSRPLEYPFIKNAGITIKVFNAIKLYDISSQDSLLVTSEAVYDYVNQLLEQSAIKFQPDWIVYDGTEVLSGILEQVMRKRNNLRPYQGIANFSAWKERKQYVDDIHNKSIRIAKKGVIYTMYTEKDEVIDKDGTILVKKDVPKWIGSIMRETDVVIRATADFIDENKKYYATVESSKLLEYPTGKYDVTDVRFRDVIDKAL